LFDAAAVEAAIKPDLSFFPETVLVALENTHNVAGGRVFPQEDVVAIAALARSRGLSVHLDGARIWNAAVATGLSPAALCAPADTVSACFSKGLGAPVGSVLAGARDVIKRARRARRRMGGGMRQVGVLCAAALHALDHNFDRLAEDHENAQRLAGGLASAEGIRCDPSAVETNIVNFDVDGDAAALVDAARDAGVLLNALGPHRIRAVTHLDVSSDDCERAAAVCAGLVERARGGG
jgi:threonine aldolase